MGESKLMLPYGTSTVLNATIAAVEASRVDRVLIVTGCEAEPMEASIETETASVVRNPDYRRGNLSSLLTATSFDARADAFVLVAGDLPTIRTQVVDTIVELWEREQPWAAVAEYRDRVAHPFLLSRDAVGTAASIASEKALWSLLVESSDDRVARVAVSWNAPRDVNTPEAYEALLGGA